MVQITTSDGGDADTDRARGGDGGDHRVAAMRVAARVVVTAGIGLSA